MPGEDTSSGWLAGLWPFDNRGLPLKHDHEGTSKVAQLDAQEAPDSKIELLTSALQGAKRHRQSPQSTEFRSNADKTQSMRSNDWLSLAQYCKHGSQERSKLKGSCVPKSGAAGEDESTEAESHVLKHLRAVIENSLRLDGLIETLMVVGRHYPKEAAALLREHAPTHPSTPRGSKTFYQHMGGESVEEWSIEEAASRILNICLPEAVDVNHVREQSDVVDSSGHLPSSSKVNPSEDSGEQGMLIPRPLWTLMRPSGYYPPVRFGEPRSLWNLLELVTGMLGGYNAWVDLGALDDETARILCWPSPGHLRRNDYIVIDPETLMTRKSKDKLFKRIRDSVTDVRKLYIWKEPKIIKIFDGPREARNGYPRREWLEWSSEDHTKAGLYEMAEKLFGFNATVQSSGLDIMQRHPERYIRIPTAGGDAKFAAEVLGHIDDDEIWLFPARMTDASRCIQNVVDYVPHLRWIEEQTEQEVDEPKEGKGPVPRVVPGIAVKVPVKPPPPVSAPAEQASAASEAPRRSSRLRATKQAEAESQAPSAASGTRRKSTRETSRKGDARAARQPARYGRGPPPTTQAPPRHHLSRHATDELAPDEEDPVPTKPSKQVDPTHPAAPYKATFASKNELTPRSPPPRKCKKLQSTKSSIKPTQAKVLKTGPIPDIVVTSPSPSRSAPFGRNDGYVSPVSAQLRSRKRARGALCDEEKEREQRSRAPSPESEVECDNDGGGRRMGVGTEEAVGGRWRKRVRRVREGVFPRALIV